MQQQQPPLSPKISNTSSQSQEAPVFKCGWLWKRGEHIKTWRPRYFVLRHDGCFYGYRKPLSSTNDRADTTVNNSQQNTKQQNEEPLNRFHITDCNIVRHDKAKPNAFVLQLNQMKIERLFAANTQQEREEWINAIQIINRQYSSPSLRQEPSRQFSLIQQHRSMINDDKMDDDAQKISYENVFARRPQINDFEYLKILGRGTFGKVVLCRERTTQRIFAMKMLRKSLVITNNEVVHTLAENKILRNIRHPFITNLICAFTTSDRLCLVMECVNGGELFFHLSKEKRFSEERTRFYIAEIACAIGYLHSRKVIYRDVKLENILLDRFGHIKLVDFGLCKMNMPSGFQTSTFCGTPQYIAPEILRMTSYSNAVDWWGLGIVMYECLIGRLPFADSKSQDGLFQKILNQEPNYPVNEISPNALDLIKKFLKKEPLERIGSTAGDVVEVEKHPFFHNISFKLYEEKKIEPLFKPELDSDTDTRYFDTEFTSEPVCITPPGSTESLAAIGVNGNIDDTFERFTYIGSEGVSHYASRSLISTTSSIQNLSHSNIYLDDPDFYHKNPHQSISNISQPPTSGGFIYQHLPQQYSVSTMNVHSSSTQRTMKNATSMQQLKGTPDVGDTELMVVDTHQSNGENNTQSTLSIPDLYQQQLINERLLCIQQMLASGQNFSTMFNDDPEFAQQIMNYLDPNTNNSQMMNDQTETMDE